MYNSIYNLPMYLKKFHYWVRSRNYWCLCLCNWLLSHIYILFQFWHGKFDGKLQPNFHKKTNFYDIYGIKYCWSEKLLIKIPLKFPSDWQKHANCFSSHLRLDLQKKVLVRKYFPQPTTSWLSSKRFTLIIITIIKIDW